MENNKKVVITYGTFDLFHKGHYNILKRAKELGDYLIVVLSSDDADFGGFDRISKDYVYHAKDDEYGYGFRLYLPCRTAAVIEKVKKEV